MSLLADAEMRVASYDTYTHGENILGIGNQRNCRSISILCQFRV